MKKPKVKKPFVVLKRTCVYNNGILCRMIGSINPTKRFETRDEAQTYLDIRNSKRKINEEFWIMEDIFNQIRKVDE